jgi:hypothetical protein
MTIAIMYYCKISAQLRKQLEPDWDEKSLGDEYQESRFYLALSQWSLRQVED